MLIFEHVSVILQRENGAHSACKDHGSPQRTLETIPPNALGETRLQAGGDPNLHW